MCDAFGPSQVWQEWRKQFTEWLEALENRNKNMKLFSHLEH